MILLRRLLLLLALELAALAAATAALNGTGMASDGPTSGPSTGPAAAPEEGNYTTEVLLEISRGYGDLGAEALADVLVSLAVRKDPLLIGHPAFLLQTVAGAWRAEVSTPLALPPALPGSAAAPAGMSAVVVRAVAVSVMSFAAIVICSSLCWNQKAACGKVWRLLRAPFRERPRKRLRQAKLRLKLARAGAPSCEVTPVEPREPEAEPIGNDTIISDASAQAHEVQPRRMVISPRKVDRPSLFNDNFCQDRLEKEMQQEAQARARTAREHDSQTSRVRAATRGEKPFAPIGVVPHDEMRLVTPSPH